nr:hypothetical protein [Tanacetum cinerariifolium]
MNDPIIELRKTFQAWLQQQEQVVNLDSYTPEPSQCRKIPIYYDDDDDEEISTPLRDIIIFELPPCIAITPVLSIEEPKNSLIMGDEHLDTIPEKESDEFIKSSVENLIPSLSKSEDISDEDVPMDNFKIFSNPLFDLDEEIISTEVNPIQNEVLESITSIPPGINYFDAESNHIESLLNQNTSINSTSKIDSLLDEFAGELIFLKSIPPGIDESDFDPEGGISLIERLLYVENSIKSFSTSPIPIEDSDSFREEIDLFLPPDDSMPPGIENDDYDSEGDILFLKELLSNYSPSLPKTESFHFDFPSSPCPPAKPSNVGIYFEPNTGLLTTKGVDNSERYVHVPNVLPTQPPLCPVIDTLLPFSFENKDKVHILSHQSFNAFQLISDSPMVIYGGNIPTLEVLFLHFYPP